METLYNFSAIRKSGQKTTNQAQIYFQITVLWVYILKISALKGPSSEMEVLSVALLSNK